MKGSRLREYGENGVLVGRDWYIHAHQPSGAELSVLAHKAGANKTFGWTCKG